MPEAKRYACQVTVKVHFLAEHSNIAQNQFAFAYTVTITNTGNVAAQLISRHWIICDSNDDRREVKGLGVVGEQPMILPDMQYSYQSHAIINTPNGYMQGSYQMIAEDCTLFDAVIPPFTLSLPSALH
jgi:ApaG protein